MNPLENGTPIAPIMGSSRLLAGACSDPQGSANPLHNSCNPVQPAASDRSPSPSEPNRSGSLREQPEHAFGSSPALTQPLEALGRANTARSGGAAVKQELKRGELSFEDALNDPRAGVLPVFALLSARRWWGRERSFRVLRAARISESRRVRDLTPRERVVLVEAIGEPRTESEAA